MIRVITCFLILASINHVVPYIKHNLTSLDTNEGLEFPTLQFTFSKCRWGEEKDCIDDAGNTLSDEQEVTTTTLLETATEKLTNVKKDTKKKETKLRNTENAVSETVTTEETIPDEGTSSTMPTTAPIRSQKSLDIGTLPADLYVGNASSGESDIKDSERGRRLANALKYNSIFKTLNKEVTRRMDGERSRSTLSVNNDKNVQAEHPLNKHARSLDYGTVKEIDKTKFPTSQYNHSIANEMARKIRILCWVITCPENHQERAIHVKNTWGKRCNKLLFMSTEADDSLPAVKLPVAEGINNQLDKIKASFQYLYENHINDADWFLKAEDDTYVIMENLRYLVAEHNSEHSIAFGCQFKFNKYRSYLKSGPGQVFSRGAIIKLYRPLKETVMCNRPRGKFKDIEMGVCIASNKVQILDSRDSEHHSRFYPYPPQVHLSAQRDPSYYTTFENEYLNMLYHNTEADKKLDCCSRHAVSFHRIEPANMYVMEYMIYHLRPYGVKFDARLSPPTFLL